MRGRDPGHGRGLLLGALVALVVVVPGVGGLAGSPAAADQSSCSAPNPPNELTLGGGTPQTAQLNTPFDGSL
jgi:hypothetical protein